MKLLYGLVAVALAQRNRPNKNNKNQNQYNEPAPTEAPYSGGGGNQYGGNQANEYGGQGYGYGDPHFMVQTLGQDALCFDYNPAAGSAMTLIMDPTTNLVITADIEGRRKGKTVFMTKVHFNSPGGAKLTISAEGVTTSGLPGSATADFDEGDIITYGDIEYKEHISEDGSREKVVVTITDGPSFLVKEKVNRETLSFGITDVRGISQKSRGVIGQFVKPNAYTIERHAENPELATVNANGVYVVATQEDFHHNHQCWTLDEDDILPVFEQI
jgi:hypothetical protein